MKLCKLMVWAKDLGLDPDVVEMCLDKSCNEAGV